MNSAERKLSVVVVDPRSYTPPYDYCLCEALASEGCQVTLACTEHGEVKWNLQGSFSLWNQFYRWTRNSKLDRGTLRAQTAAGLDHVLSMRRFAALMRRTRPDIIHFQWLPAPLIDQAYLRQLRRRAKLVLTLHNTTLFHGAISRWRGLGFASALKQFDAVIVHTEFSKRKVIKWGWIDERRIQVIPHGAFHYYRSFETGPAEPGSFRTLLFFGNLHSYKGIDVLLEAFARLSPEVREQTRLVIAGRPIMNVASLLDLSRRLGIEDRIQWMLRPIAEEEIPVLFRSATAVVLPYREIDQSGVLMTAIAFGKPIVASQVGGIPETVEDEVHGYLVPPGNAEALANALERMLSSREQMQAMALRVANLGDGKLSWSSIASETMHLYRHLLQHKYLDEPLDARMQLDRTHRNPGYSNSETA